MLSNFLAKSKPINFILIIGLFLLYFFTASFHYFSTENLSLVFVLKQSGLILLFLIFFFLFNFIRPKNQLTLDNSYSLLIFVTIIGISPKTLFDFNQLIFNILLLLFYRKIYSLKRNTLFIEKNFDAGLLLGVLFVVEPFSIVFAFLIYSTVYLFQQITFKTLLIPFFGFVIPVFLYFSFCFYLSDLQRFNSLFYWYTNYNFETYYKTSLWIPILLVTLFTIIAFLAKTSRAFRISGNYRAHKFLLFIHLLICLLFIALLRDKNGSELLVTFFPIAIVIANWLETSQKKIMNNILLIMFILIPFIFAVLLSKKVVVF